MNGATGTTLLRLGLRPPGSARGRIALTFIDQAVSSGSNFVTGVVIARLAGAAEFGEYALTLTLWLVIVGLHRALITEAVIVAAASQDDPDIVAHGVAAELLLGTVVSAAVALGGLAAIEAGARVGVLMLALAPWFVALLLQDFWRAMSFRARRPGLALIDDLVFAAVQFGAIAAFLELGWRSAPWVVTAWGLGATVGALLGLRWFPARASLGEGWRLLRRLWNSSRWLLADFVTGFVSDQAYIAFAAVVVAPSDYGGFRAAFSLMGPAYVIALACGNVGLPAAARLAGPGQRADLRRFSRRLSTGTAAAIGAYGLLVAVGGRFALKTVYGPNFARFAPLATLCAVGYLLLGAVFGSGIALKAAGRMRLLWRTRVLVALVSLVSMVLLVESLGVTGAGWASVLTPLCFTAAVLRLYRRELGALAVHSAR